MLARSENGPKLERGWIVQTGLMVARVCRVTDRTNQGTAVALQKDSFILCARLTRRDRRIVMDMAAIVMLGSIVLYLLHQVESLTS